MEELPPAVPFYQNKRILFIAIPVVVIVLLLLVVVIAGSGQKGSSTTAQNGSGNTSLNTGNSGSTGTRTGGTGKSTGSGTVSKPTPVATKLPTKEDVNRVLFTWLDKQKGKDGVYYGQVTCNESGTCSNAVPSSVSGVNMIWSRYKLYQKSKDANDLKAIVADLNTYTDKNKVPSIQNYFLNCRLMYELWTSTDFTTDQKDKIKHICYDSQPFPPPESSIPQIDLNTVMNHSAQPVQGVDGANMLYYAIGVSDLIAQNTWTPNQAYIDSAKDTFNTAVAAYVAPNSKKSDAPILGLASFDLYQATKDTKYLNFAYFIYNDSAKHDCASPAECSYMIYFAQEIHKTLQNPQYVAYASKAQQLLVNNWFDYAGYPSYKSGVGAFRADTNKDNLIFSVIDNSFIAGLLIL